MVFTKMANLLAEIIGADPDDISPETSLCPTSGIEPIDLAKLIIACEKKFKITIYDEHVHHFQTVGNVVTYIENILAEGIENFSSQDDADKQREAWYYQ